MKNGKHINEYGTERWFQNGKLHRDNGPAEIYSNGTTCWYQNGKLHRCDGPAMVWTDGQEFWYLNGIELTESELLILKEKIGFNEMMKDLLTEDSA